MNFAVHAEGGRLVAASALRRQIAEGRLALRQRFAAKPDATRLLRDHTRMIDEVLRAIWGTHHLPDATLVAVGGYGRMELFPASDIDLLILLPRPPDEATREEVERLVGFLWDIGLEIGHSVRTQEECLSEAALDLTVQTNQLEARYVAGERDAFLVFQAAVREQLDAEAFFKAKRLEQDQRHQRFQEAAYSLEPNCKEAPGGLRDLQMVGWLMSAAKLGTTWMSLAEGGVVTSAEARQLHRHERLLREIRIRMHHLVGRREDRLLFDHQDALAREFKFTDGQHRRASELFMQRYYRTAKAVMQLNTIVLQNLGAQIFPTPDEVPRVLNERFQVRRDLLDARSPTLFEQVPSAILESFLLLQEHAELKGMTAPTLRALWRARTKIDAEYRHNSVHQALFLRIMQQPRGIVHELRRMNQYGILGRYIPQFGRIVGQMQHDLFHVYTVDQHILMVVRNLRRYTMLEFSHEYPLCSRIVSGFERHWLLYVAGLFHDIAKGRGGDHSKMGERDARRFCHTHGLSDADTDLVAWLVEHHLVMSAVAQKQDLSDTDVIARFAALVGSERRLQGLYLLTVADIRGTSPKVWNQWKAKLLEDLYRLTLRMLRGGAPRPELDMQEKQAEAVRILRLYALSDTAQEALWAQLDVAYFLRHDAQEIAWQTRTLHYRVSNPEPVVKARLAPIGEGLQVMIYTPDQPELFARICGVFGRLNFSIVEAKIHTTRHGYALDSFLVLDPAKHQNYRDVINLIETELTHQIARGGPLAEPRQGRGSRRLKAFPIVPEVNLRPDERGAYHLLSITAGDRPGLLHAIARVLGEHQINLHTAKITTLGERAEDVFVVSGRGLSDAREAIRLEQELLQVLQPEARTSLALPP